LTSTQQRAVEAVKRLGSQVKAAKELGISRQAVAGHLAKFAKKQPAGSSAVLADENKPGCETTQTADGFLVSVRSYDRIQTAEQAMAKAGLDAAIWKPVKTIANSWEVAARELDGSIVTRPLWQVKVFCDRRVSEAIENSADILAQRLFGGKFKLTAKKFKRPSDPKTMVIGLVDHHFGKLCWKPETGNDYDLNIAESLYSRAIEATVGQASGQQVSEIILPIGNDFGHIDTRARTTEAGTPQDQDGRYEKMSGILEQATLNAVNVARQIAPVRVLWVGGNHDPITSMWLCRCVHHAFKSDKHVTVDTSPRPVKYIQFGKCLLGFAHVDAPREKALKDMMPIEQADAWAASKSCREWLTGHLHQQKKTERLGTFEEAGMVFRILPSLCGTDSWHYRNGFSMSRKATESYLYSHKWGFSGCFSESAEKLSS
jgi:hypothetical protein